MGVTLVGMLVLSMLMGAWVAGAAPVTPTITVNPLLEFSIAGTTVAFSVNPGATNSGSPGVVSVKSNSAWSVTIGATTPLASTTVPADTVPASMFKLTTAGATTVYDNIFPAAATSVLSAARGSYDACSFTYTVDLTSAAGWEVVPHTDYTCAHAYTASNP